MLRKQVSKRLVRNRKFSVIMGKLDENVRIDNRDGVKLFVEDMANKCTKLKEHDEDLNMMFNVIIKDFEKEDAQYYISRRERWGKLQHCTIDNDKIINSCNCDSKENITFGDFYRSMTANSKYSFPPKGPYFIVCRNLESVKLFNSGANQKEIVRKWLNVVDEDNYIMKKTFNGAGNMEKGRFNYLGHEIKQFFNYDVWKFGIERHIDNDWTTFEFGPQQSKDTYTDGETNVVELDWGFPISGSHINIWMKIYVNRIDEIVVVKFGSLGSGEE